MSEILATYAYTLINDDQEYSITCNNLKEEPTLAVIPSEYEGLPVTEIGENAFYDGGDNLALTKVIISDSIIAIRNNAFRACKNADIDFGSNVEIIGQWAFTYNQVMETLILPTAIKKICFAAFFQCPNLKKVVFPEGLLQLGGFAFARTPLEEVILPDSLLNSATDDDELGTNVSQIFAYCSNVKNIFIGSGLTTISAEMFYENTSLESLVIPTNITTIGARSFRNCTKLKRLVIGNSVRTIDNNGFLDCTALSEIYLLPSDASSLPTLGTNVFNNTASAKKFYCKKSVLNAYKQAAGWSSFSDYFEANDGKLNFILNSNSTKKYISKKIDRVYLDFLNTVKNLNVEGGA